MIYLLNLQFAKLENVVNKDFYYSILWAILWLLDSESDIYENISKISFNLWETLNVSLWIVGDHAYTNVVNILLYNPNKIISIDWVKFELKHLKFDFRTYDLDSIEFVPFDKFEIKYFSPTFTRSTNIVSIIPEIESVVLGLYEKLSKMYDLKIDKLEFKKWIKNNVILWRYNIRSQRVKIKWNYKAWCVWDMLFHLMDKESEYVKLLYLCLKAAKFLWMWSSTKLGCWNVWVHFLYDK